MHSPGSERPKRKWICSLEMDSVVGDAQSAQTPPRVLLKPFPVPDPAGSAGNAQPGAAAPSPRPEFTSQHQHLARGCLEGFHPASCSVGRDPIAGIKSLNPLGREGDGAGLRELFVHQLCRPFIPGQPQRPSFPLPIKC